MGGLGGGLSMGMTGMGMGMEAMGAPKGNPGGANPNDWACPNTDCWNHTHMVFAKHMACPKCGAEKPMEQQLQQLMQQQQQQEQQQQQQQQEAMAAMGGLGGGLSMGMTGMGMGMEAMGAPKGNPGGANPNDWACPNTDCWNHTHMVFA